MRALCGPGCWRTTVEALFYGIAAAGVEPNGNAILECARRHGCKFNRGEALAFLRELRSRSRAA